MWVKPFQDGESFECAGNKYLMLITRDLTECCEVVLERIAVGGRTPSNAHLSFVQVYVVLAGEAEITVGDEVRCVSAPAVAFIPRNTQHKVLNTGAVELQYLYITIWPGEIPREERKGGWKKACADMIQDYANRGFPPKPRAR